MKTSDILHEFHRMPACDRLDLICRLLRSCVPYELRFLGTVILDSTRAQLNSFASTEVIANHVNYFSGFKDAGLSHAVCEKLCCALAVVHADNHPVAETVFGLLNNRQALTLFEETTDLKVLDDFRLLYVMAVNHPALSFNQRQHLLYLFLQRMDLIYAEKYKCGYTGSLSSSMEKTADGELGKYPQNSRREPAKDAYMTYCDVHSVYKRPTDKRYAYMIQVEWTDGTSCCVRRTYGDYFSFHTKLLDLFPEEAGQRHKKERMIPFLPGKSYPRILTNRNNRELAEKRLPELHRYAKELIALPERISRSAHVLDFFRPRPEDLKEEYPPIQKTTTLYDLLESGKARLRNYSDPPGKGSPTHSPLPLRSSPLHRATGDSPSSSPQQSRTAHTLPHHSTTAVSQSKEESPLERRFTYPSRRSAFTPVTPPTQHQAPPTSSHLTNSHPAIANGTPSLESVAVTSQPTVTTSPSLPTSSHITSITASSSQPTYSAHTATVTTTVSTISPSHPHISSKHTVTTTGPTYTGLAKPTPTYAHSHHHKSTITSPTKPSPPSHPHSSTGPTTQSLVSPTITHTQVHTHTITPSPPPPPLHSAKTTVMGELPYNFPQFVAMPHPLPLPFSPVSPYITGYSSPIHSPSPSPITPRVKSHTHLARTPTEFDSLTKWLKGHRLHKYAPIFENMTFEELLTIDKDHLKKKGMTEGAAKKLILKIEELKSSNFGGFRDMPYNLRMSRKPSTCSLPAALLAERGVTPSSSIDGLSPTDSTCSLDKGTGSVPQSAKSDLGTYAHSNGPSSHDTGSAMSNYDAAILKVVPTSSATAVMNGDAVLGGYMNLDLSSPTSHQPPLYSLSSSGETQLDTQSDVSSVVGRSDVSQATSSLLGTVGVARQRSWADQVVPGEEGSDAGKPEWAQLSSESRTGRSHTPTHPHQHTPLAQRHSAEKHDSKGAGHTHNGPAVAAAKGHHHTPTRNPAPSGPGSWTPPAHRLPVHAPGRGVRPPPQPASLHPVAAPHPVTVVSANGLIHTPGNPPPVTVVRMHHPPPYTHGLMANQGRGAPPPLTCFNCGKRGHLGNTCPGETMDTHNPDMFHKQLERLATKQASNSHKAL